MAAVWDGADPCPAKDAASVLRDNSLTGTITVGGGGDIDSMCTFVSLLGRIAQFHNFVRNLNGSIG